MPRRKATTTTNTTATIDEQPTDASIGEPFFDEWPESLPADLDEAAIEAEWARAEQTFDLSQETTEAQRIEDDTQAALTDAQEREIEEALRAAQSPTIEVTQDALAAGRNVQTMTAIFELKINGVSFTSKVGSKEVVTEEHQEAADLLKTSLRLIDCPELDAVRQVGREFKRWLGLRQAPCSLLRGGMYLIPLSMVDKVDERYKQMERDRQEALRAFLGVYQQRKAEAAQKLGNLYREELYPTVKEIAARFTTSCRWLAFDAPAALESINSDLWKENAKRLEVQMAEAASDMRDALRATMAKYVSWLAERLTGKADDGKRKGIAESKLEDMRTFLANFSALNLTNDAELAQLVDQAQAAMQGIDIKTIKGDDGAREAIRQQFESIQKATDSWVVNKTRVIASDDEV